MVWWWLEGDRGLLVEGKGVGVLPPAACTTLFFVDWCGDVSLLVVAGGWWGFVFFWAINRDVKENGGPFVHAHARVRVYVRVSVRTHPLPQDP
jgi:hypothetical protein